MKLPAPRHWKTIAEAGAALVAARLATAVLPFERYIGMAARPITAARPPRDGRTESWIVDSLADRAPFRAVCLQRGLALQWMLRRRGIDAMLHYGVKLNDGEGPSAHVWISVGEEVINGAPQHLCYTEVARYPAK